MTDAPIHTTNPQPERKPLRAAAWLKKLQDHGFFCHYCKEPLSFDTAVKEHLTPLCRGGADTIANIVPACLSCNLMKAWRTEEEFLRDFHVLKEKRTAHLAIGKPKPFRISPEERNEPGLLKKLYAERERVSWAWRNPA